VEADSVENIVYHVTMPHSMQAEGFVEDSRVFAGLDVPAAFYDAPETQLSRFQRRGLFSPGSS